MFMVSLEKASIWQESDDKGTSNIISRPHTQEDLRCQALINPLAHKSVTPLKCPSLHADRAKLYIGQGHCTSTVHRMQEGAMLG